MYYGHPISPHIIKTPEGYLICKDVPINRIGTYDYLGNELGLSGTDADKTFKVLRRPEDVFRPATLASFEGKPTCDEHPPEDVGPENRQYYNKGHAHNIRKGTGQYEGYTIADLQIEDPQLIEDVENGKREISCGYDFDLFQNPNGTYEQRNMVGNHIAIVPSGRAGPSVAIRDSKPKITERGTKMANTPTEKSKHAILGRFFRTTAKDESIPDEELGQLMTEFGLKAKDGELVEANPLPEIKDPKSAPAKDAEPSPAGSELHELLELLKAFMARETPAKPADDDLQNLIDPKPEKAAHEEPDDDDMGPEESEEAVVIDPEDVEERDHSAARDAMSKAAKIMQAQLAEIYKNDPAAYKAHAKDAAVKLSKAFGVSKPDDSGYARIVTATRQSQASRTAQDSMDADERAAAEAQANYDAVNPHKAKEAK